MSHTTSRYRYIGVQLGEPFNRIAELPLIEVSFERRRNSAGTFSAKLPMPTISGGGQAAMLDAADVARAKAYKEGTEAGVTCIYVLRDNTPLGGWIVWEQSYDAGSQTISVSGSEFMSYFTRRTISDTNPAATVTLENMTSSRAARELLIAANDIGLVFDDLDAVFGTVVASRAWKGTDAKSVADTVKELADNSGGFEWYTSVRRVTGGYERYFFARETIGGQVGAVASLGRNVLTLTATVAGSKRVSDALALGGNTNDDRPFGQASDPLALTPRLTGVLQFTDLADTNVLEAQAEADVAVNVYPEQLSIELIAQEGAVEIGAFNPGDLVRLQVSPGISPWWPEGIDRMHRAIGVTVSVPNTGGVEKVGIALEGDRD